MLYCKGCKGFQIKKKLTQRNSPSCIIFCTPRGHRGQRLAGGWEDWSMCWRKGGDKLLITRKSNPVTATNCQDHLPNWCALLLDASRAGLQHPAAPPPVIPPQRARTAIRSSVRTGYGSGRSAPPCCCLPPLWRIEQRRPDEPPPSWLLRRAMA